MAKEEISQVERLKEHFAKLNAQDAETNLRLQAEVARLRSVLEEFATDHHNPPVPLWISIKARNALV